MTPGECMAMLAIAAKAYARDLSTGIVETWAEFLGDVSLDEGVRAMREHVAESDRFPTVADIRKRVASARVGGAGDPGHAWAEVRRAIAREGRDRSPSWSHPAIESAVEALGWREICNTLDSDLPTVRAQFERYFRAALEGRAKAANYGALEAHAEKRRGLIPAGEAVTLALVKAAKKHEDDP